MDELGGCVTGLWGRMETYLYAFLLFAPPAIFNALDDSLTSSVVLVVGLLMMFSLDAGAFDYTHRVA